MTKLKGNIQMVFKSKIMRDACLMGFQLLVLNRQMEEMDMLIPKKE